MTLSFLLIGCSEKKDNNQKYDPVIPVNVIVVEMNDDSNVRNYVGTLQSEVKLALSFPLGGTITNIYVHNGQKVKKGELIGYVGNTGLSVAPHCHYEVIKDGQRVNPVHYFFNDLTPEEYNHVIEAASKVNQALS